MIWQEVAGKAADGGKVNNRRAPDLSVVIVTPDCYQTIRKTIRHLRAQTVKDRLEIVIVAPSADTLALEESELREFCQFRVVEVGMIRSIGEANAVGVRHASAAMVALTEDHVSPDPGWAEALLAAHQEPWAAVGPEVRNANPESLISWADFLIGYGPWSEPATAGEMEHLPGHNSSYKRTILLDYGPELPTLLQAESVLHWDLRAKGYRLYIEPKAKIAHLNFTLWSTWLPAQFYSGRLFAAVRARRWSLLRRLFYTGGALLIPPVRLSRLLRQRPRSSGRPRMLWLRAVPVLILGLVVSALGEMIGYSLRAGDTREKLSAFEFHRV
ncbi:MAG TPA: glycosyltransferase [Candidatus Binatia bacterium]|jgi:glycosyltransferase involved in cell wall biosynthesis|nr:glycosyltransferase [Candidatus Binatia bacterium]